MDIWLTSDTHFDHFNVIEYENRPFQNQFEMTEQLIENWNCVVKPHDLIFHLGDVFFCKADRMKEISNRLNGRKILIRGNHDKGLTNGKFRNLGFDVYQYYLIDQLFLSHYPQHESPIKTAIEHELLLGNVHGHVHSHIEHLNQQIYRCVSVELTEYKPVHLEDVKRSFLLS